MGGGGHSPELPPTPAPTPIPQPSTVEPQATEGQRANKIMQMKKGILSTIKTAPGGITGSGSDLTSQQGNKTLGGS
jgi:hypothetical protein